MRTSSRRFKAAEAIRSTIYSPGCIRPDSEAGPRCNRSFTKMPSLMLPHTLKPRPVKSRLRRLTTLTRVALGCTKQNGRGPICYTGNEDTCSAGVAFYLRLWLARTRPCIRAWIRIGALLNCRSGVVGVDDQWTGTSLMTSWSAKRETSGDARERKIQYTSYSHERQELYSLMILLSCVSVNVRIIKWSRFVGEIFVPRFCFAMKICEIIWLIFIPQFSLFMWNVINNPNGYKRRNVILYCYIYY